VYPNIGLDYKIEYYINETKAKIAEEEQLKLKKIAKQKLKEEEKKASKK
jgi:outer membrane protein assembly factor BamD